MTAHVLVSTTGKRHRLKATGRAGTGTYWTACGRLTSGHVEPPADAIDCAHCIRLETNK